MRLERSELSFGRAEGVSGEKPILAAYFEGIRNIKTERPVDAEIKPVFAEKSFRNHAYQKAQELWEYEYDEDRLRKCLEQDPSDENFEYLKELRKAGLVLKNMNLFFLKDPKTAENFNVFVTHLGKFNDRYQKKGRVDAAEKVKAKLSAIDTVHGETRGDEEFIDYCENKLTQMLEMFEYQNLPEKEFHQLRKDIRAFAHLMLVPATENPEGPELWIFRSLDKLSGSFGKARNNFDKESEFLQVDPKDKDRFMEVLPLLKKSLGLAKEVHIPLKLAA